ncbi:MAG: GNAT family N-acetyltransferase [Pseudonocardiaceae bacterium]
MTKPELRIARHDAADTIQLREPLKALYLRSHLDQQHIPFYSPAQFWERLEELYAPGRGFGTVTGWLDDVMVGYAFGSPRDRTQDVWNEVRDALPDVPVPERPEPVYIFRELAVDPAWQRHGFGRALHDALLENRAERLAHLLVRPDNVAARSAYLAWGWRKIREIQPFPDAPIMDAMVLRLRPST